MIGENMKRARKAKGISQEEMAVLVFWWKKFYGKL